MTQYGATSYSYTANGDLQTKTNDGQTTTYDYDTQGNLTNVTLSDGTQIEYLIDGLNRRIGKKVNGSVVRRFLIYDQSPLAELDRLDRIDALIAEAGRAGVPVGVLFQDRFKSGLLWAKALVDEGAIGTPILVRAEVPWYRPPEYYAASRWRGTWALDGGGAVMNQGIHTVDVLQHLAGQVESVFAQTRTAAHERIEVEDVAVLFSATNVFDAIDPYSIRNSDFGTRNGNSEFLIQHSAFRIGIPDEYSSAICIQKRNRLTGQRSKRWGRSALSYATFRCRGLRCRRKRRTRFCCPRRRPIIENTWSSN